MDAHYCSCSKSSVIRVLVGKNNSTSHPACVGAPVLSCAQKDVYFDKPEKVSESGDLFSPLGPQDLSQCQPSGRPPLMFMVKELHDMSNFSQFV